MKPIVLHPEARAELRAAKAYYAGQRAHLKQDFQLEFKNATERIQQNPKAFSTYGEGGHRKCLMHRFPYTIYFMELDEVIWVAAVVHQRRRPGYWLGRTPE